jgi:hypothetical protein
MRRAADLARRVVVTTFGSLGDLHPYLALALGLRARGHDVVVATGKCYRDKIEALGLGFAPVRPDSDWVIDPEMMRLSPNCSRALRPSCTTAGSAPRVWQCARGAPGWSCPAPWTNGTTRDVRFAWASPARFRGTATRRPPLPPNFITCSTTPPTQGGRPQSPNKSGKKMECWLLVTLSQACFSRP